MYQATDGTVGLLAARRPGLDPELVLELGVEDARNLRDWIATTVWQSDGRRALPGLHGDVVFSLKTAMTPPMIEISWGDPTSTVEHPALEVEHALLFCLGA